MKNSANRTNEILRVMSETLMKPNAPATSEMTRKIMAIRSMWFSGQSAL